MWLQSDEQLFLEEEREKQLEQTFEQQELEKRQQVKKQKINIRKIKFNLTTQSIQIKINSWPMTKIKLSQQSVLWKH